MPATQAHNSLSKAEYFTWAVSSFLEKNPSGCQPAEGEERCCKAAPTWSAEASTMRQISAPGDGCTRYVALVTADLAALKASIISGDHWTSAVGFGEPFRLSVKGFKNLAAPGRNRR